MRNASKLYVLPLVVTVFAGSASAREADVEAISTKSGQHIVVAMIRDDIVACRTQYGPDAWLEWDSKSDSVRLVDGKEKREANLDSAGIQRWARYWQGRLDAQRDAAKELAQRDDLPPEARLVLTRFSDGARAIQEVPSLAATVRPAKFAQPVPELVNLQKRLHPLLASLQLSLRHAGVALEMLACAVPATSLPAEFVSAPANERGTVKLVPLSGGSRLRDQNARVEIEQMFVRDTKPR